MARQLKVQYDADASPVQRAMSAMQGNIAAFAGGLTGIQKAAAIGLGAVVVGGAAAGVALYKVGKTFDEAYDTIRVGTGATGKSLEGLQGSFKNVVKDVPADFSSASTAIADLNTRTGLTGKSLEQMSKQQLELARITKTDVATNIAATTRVFGDWGIATDKQSGAMDKMFRASQATGVGVDKLASQVVQFGAPLRQMGFDFDTSIGLLGKFEKEGVNSELVMGSMRIALGKLAKEGKEPVAAFREQVEAIKATGDAGKANALAMELFGARAGPDMAAAIREGRFELGDLLNTISNGEETILGAGKATQDMAEKWQMFKNRVLVALEPLAMRVFNGVGKAFDIIAPKLEGFLNLVEKGAEALSKMDPAALKFIASVAGVGVAVLGTVLAVNKVIKVFNTLKWALAMNPFVLITAAVVGLVYLIVTNWETIKSVIGAGWDWVKTKTEGIWNGIKDFISQWWPLLLGIFTGGIGLVVGLVIQNWDSIKAKTSEIWSAIAGFFSSTWETIKAGFTAALTAITSFLTDRWNNLKSTTMSVWNSVKDFLAGIWNGIKSAAQAAWNFITTSITNALNTARSTVQNVWNSIKSTVEGVVNGIKSTVTGAWNNIRDTITGAINSARDSVRGAINSIKGYFDGLLHTVKRVVRYINDNMQKLAFWRRSPSLMEKMAKGSVEGISVSFAQLPDLIQSSVREANEKLAALKPPPVTFDTSVADYATRTALAQRGSRPALSLADDPRFAGRDRAPWTGQRASGTQGDRQTPTVQIENVNLTVQNPADIASGIARELGWKLQGISRGRGLPAGDRR